MQNYLFISFSKEGEDEKQSKSPANSSPSLSEKRINGPISIAACTLALAGSAFFSLQLSNPDMGMTISADQIQELRQQEVVRIKNDPKMPEKAKRIALKMLGADYSKLR